jgi:hypothetical protein
MRARLHFVHPIEIDDGGSGLEASVDSRQFVMDWTDQVDIVFGNKR